MTVGIDEVGRGCWAGPLVAGAVVLSKPLSGLKDSKKLSKAQRTKLDIQIREEALAFSLGWVAPLEVDELGLTEAVRLAMQRAIDQIEIRYDNIVIDGNYNFLSHMAISEALVKADDLVPSVSAASIIAKVARDTCMENAATQYPEYGFERHVGYGTALHVAALMQYGPCEIHRKSYKPIKALLH